MEESLKYKIPYYIYRLGQLIYKNKWFLIVPAILIPLAAIASSFAITPAYIASTTILINELSFLPGQIEEELFVRRYQANLTSSILKESFSRQLKSEKNLKRLIAQLDIDIPEDFIKTANEYTSTRPDLSAADIAENMLVGSINRQIGVWVQGTNLVTISVISSSPELAYKIARNLPEIFIEENLAQTLSNFNQKLVFTNDQLDTYRENLYNAQHQLKEFRKKIISTAAEDDTLNTNLGLIIAEIEVLDFQIDNTTNKIHRIKKILNSNQIDLFELELPSHINKLRDKILDKSSLIADLTSSYTWQNAKAINLNQEVNDLILELDVQIEQYVKRNYPNFSRNLQDNISNYLNLNIILEFMQKKNTLMNRNLGILKSRLTQNLETEIELNRLLLEVEHYQQLCQIFERFSAITAINQSAEKYEIKNQFIITNEAELPIAPFNSNRPRLVLIGIILGILIGSTIIFYKTILDDSFIRIRDVESYLGHPVIAIIPYIFTPFAEKNKDRFIMFFSAFLFIILVSAIAILYFIY